MKSVFSIFRSSSRSAQKGFSLLEIIVVLAIIGMLIGIIVTRIAGSRESSYESLTGTKAANLYAKIIQYQLLNDNKFPADIADVVGTASDEGKDSWGNPFCYIQKSGDVYIGSNGKAGTAVTICYVNGKKSTDSAVVASCCKTT